MIEPGPTCFKSIKTVRVPGERMILSSPVFTNSAIKAYFPWVNSGSNSKKSGKNRDYQEKEDISLTIPH